MADEQPAAGSIAGGGNAGNTDIGAVVTLSPNRLSTSMQREERDSTPASGRGVEAPVGLSLQRAGTLPIRRHGVEGDNVEPETRRPGRTISSKPRNLEAPPLSPRSQIFGRKPSTNRDNREGSLGPIPERGQAPPATSRPRGSTNSERPSFSSPGMRPRMTTWANSPNRARGSTLTRRPTVLLAQAQAQTTGRDMDAQSATFTLAGPQQIDTLAANQPYVDPGYADLNPAYDQPVNTRPVWGLAKPLPRVIRAGMVPTKSELKLQIPEARKQDPANVDLEHGRVEPTLRLGKISSQLQSARQQRENRLLQTYNEAPLSATSPIGRQTSSITGPLSPQSQAIEEEEEDVGLGHRLSDHLPPVQEQPGPTKESQAQQYWYPDDAASIVTEKEHDGDLDGDWIGEEIPLKAYDPENDEIHNLHTHWSVIRLRFREPLAELLAVGSSEDCMIMFTKTNNRLQFNLPWDSALT
jgi:aquaglyceroporin related protein, other eukaryote